MRYFVVAGNYHQFKNWCKENSVSSVNDAIFVDEPSRLRGVNFENKNNVAVLYGTYYEKSNWNEIRSELEKRQNRLSDVKSKKKPN